ncbi:MAG: DNA polymerase/3'-5' exonuclease PolX [Magnetospirillum sp.]|nr:DNA polymerase/3'-5' exonuclease PolX [Magnetospirillum sp.]
MAVSNERIAAVFDEIGDLLEIAGANPFRVRAYRNAARTLRSSGVDMAEAVAAAGAVPHLPGIGHDLAEKAAEIVRTGHCAALDDLHAQLPATIVELLKLPGLGPKRVKKLHDALGVRSVEDLRRAAASGRIHDLAGFGDTAEERILAAIAARAGATERFRLDMVAPVAGELAAWLRAEPGVTRVEIAGSFRRANETVGDLDILVTGIPGCRVMERFTHYRDVAEIVESGPTRSTVRLDSGLQVDLRLVPEESYGAALAYFTGSKAHNILVRRLGQERGLKINEYGVFRDDRRIGGDSEESVYAAVGLPWIPPELREDRGEIDAARAGRLPRLVELSDIRGDLHVHTRATDGRESIRDMALAARDAGLEYVAITDHSRHLAVAHGLDERRLAAQGDEIDRLNAEGLGIAILKGIEVDILEDGALDLPDEALGRLDLVVAAVHSHFELPRDTQTARILRAMDHPHFTILAHPSGRRLPDRAPFDVDLEAVIRHAARRGCFLELNAQPERLDLTDTWCRAAKEHGVRVAIDSDAHSGAGFGVLAYGIGQARRGWLGRDDVLNARGLRELRPLLRALSGER